jgi:hypothetical protein
MHPLRGSRQRRPGAGLRENLPDRRDPFGTKKEMLEVAQERRDKLKSAAIHTPGFTTRRAWAAPT